MSDFEQSISSFFDNESENMKTRHEENGLPTSAKLHIEAIVSSQIDTVVDVGSGPGSVLIELLEKGVDNVTGVDLSRNMNEIARNKIEERGFSERCEIIEGSFLEIELPAQEAVSLHRVLCRHPNKDQMISKCISLQPRIVSITLLRDWKVLRGIVGLLGFVLEKLGKFRPFVHSQKDIDKMFEDNEYEVMEQSKDWFWTTTTYRLKNSDKEE